MSLVSTIVSTISSWFTRYPKNQVSSYGSVYSAVVSRLTRTGVEVGGTAGYPRIEVHSISEGEPLDKEGELRQVSLTVESISNKSMSECVNMNDTNLRLLTESDLSVGTGWLSIGVVPVQLQDLTETSDTNTIIYRLLQQFNIFIMAVKDTPPTPPATDNNSSSNT